MDMDLRKLWISGGLIGLATLLSALGFMGWMNHGSTIFLSLAQNGLSWCF
jgi:hypothetical protein